MVRQRTLASWALRKKAPNLASVADANAPICREAKDTVTRGTVVNGGIDVATNALLVHGIVLLR